MSNRVSRSESLRTIPPLKLSQELELTLKECREGGGSCSDLHSLCDKCRAINSAKRRYWDSNIPLAYWRLRMSEFQGTPLLKKRYEEIVEDLDKVYNEGWCYCFAGSHGVGKTMTVTNVLKEAAKKGYQCLYVTLSDVVANAVSNSADKYVARKELMMVDFLVIDEFDGRHMGSGAGAELYGRLLEEVLRKRVENQLPLFMCTNSPSVVDSFEGPLRQSIGSLRSFAKVIPVLDKDFRQREKK